MKKIIIGILVLVLSFTCFLGCRQRKNDKYTIYVSVFNGGHGTAWADVAATDFNAQNEVYKVVIVPELSGGADVIADVASGSPTASAYYTCAVEFQRAFYQGHFEDMSDILTMKPDGDDKSSVGDKMLYNDLWMQAASKSGEGCYMLPYADSILGWVYDQQLFVEKGWLTFADGNDAAVVAALTAQNIVTKNVGGKLFYVSGSIDARYMADDRILTPGKDGKYGTYDDGQPITLEQFNIMMQKIYASNSKGFIWSGMNNPYTDDIFNGVFAQYVGTADFNTYYNFDSGDGQIRMADNTAKTININNGYDVYGIKGIHETFNFINTYMNDTKYLHAASLKSDTSHYDAQNLFLLSYQGKANNPQTAMLVDGDWWENEARSMLSSLEVENRGYGDRDYRYMLYPNLPGQKGADGNGNGSAFATRESSAIVLSKSKDADKLAKTKEFIAFTMKDKYLKLFTTNSGSVRPYKYTLSQQELAGMTPFARTIWEIYNDEENIAIVRPPLNKVASPMAYSTTANGEYFPMNIDDALFRTPILALQRYSVDKIASSIKNYYTAASWKTLVEQAKASGFYK